MDEAGDIKLKIRDLPIHFIVGYVRTGSTLLMALLREHPEIETDVQEPNFLYRLVNSEYRYDLHEKCFNIPKAKSFDMYWKAVEIMTRYYFDELCKMTEKSVVVIKHPYLGLRMGLINRMFWRGKFIHILRHPYDALASAYHFTKLHWEAGSALGNTMEEIIENYIDWMMKILNSEQELGPKLIRIRFEDLVEHTAEALADMFQFLDVRYGNNLIDNILAKAKKNKLVLVGGPLHHSAIAKPGDLFNTKLDGKQRDLIRKKTRYFLELFQYEEK